MPTATAAGFIFPWFGNDCVQDRRRFMRLVFDRQRELIVGVGSALVDILIHESDAFLEKSGAIKGGMTLVDEEFIQRILERTSSKPVIVSGGSACNTIVGVGQLDGRARFVGKCGSGEWGRRFRRGLITQNVEPALFSSLSPTGRVLSIITPDAQRSMFTFLGASSETQADEISSVSFENTAVVHIEGYLLFNPELILAAVKHAKACGAMVSLDLASFTVVDGARDLLDHIVTNFVDIVIANEDEARVFTGCTIDMDALEVLAQKADIAVVKLGRRGSLIAYQNAVLKIEVRGDGNALDTTGAGDLWAAGFLYGLVKGYPLELCGDLGSMCGYEVCQVIGACIPEDGWKRIKRMEAKWLEKRKSAASNC
jgi:sugar/nucleoside kinase (ribokinase family)